MFHDLGIQDKENYSPGRAREIVHALINDNGLEAQVIARLNDFQEATSIIYDSRKVPIEKKKRDAEDVMRHMFLGYKKTCPVFEEDYVKDKTVTVTGEYAFLYALDLAVRLGKKISELLPGNGLFDPLLLREKLRGEPTAKSEVIKIGERPDFRVGEMPHKLVVYAVDRGAGKRAVMTYEQIAKATAERITSIGRYGIVPGGVVGGNFHRTIFGSVDRADLCMLNYDQLHQAVVLCPVDRFAQAQYTFKPSIAVMVNSDKAKGLDLIVTSSAGERLPAISPRDCVLVVPTTLSVESHRSNIITYDPLVWSGFHHFNEWLQTTPAGVDILEHAFGRRMDQLKSVEGIRSQ